MNKKTLKQQRRAKIADYKQKLEKEYNERTHRRMSHSYDDFDYQAVVERLKKEAPKLTLRDTSSGKFTATYTYSEPSSYWVTSNDVSMVYENSNAGMQPKKPKEEEDEDNSIKF